MPKNKDTPLTVEVLLYSGFVERYDCCYQMADIIIFHETDRSFTLDGHPDKMKTVEQLQEAINNS